MKLQIFPHTLYFVFTVVERKSGNLSTVKKGNEADSENEVSENEDLFETLAKPSAAIQNWCHPDFPSAGPLFKPSVMSSAVTGLPEVSFYFLF